MIDSLQSLRALFAIMVFLSHFWIDGDGRRAFYDGGTMGVEYFMILSGFVLCAAYEAKALAGQLNYRRFELKRIIRIYPLHLACFVLWLVVNIGFVDVDFTTAIANLLLVQAWSHDVNVFYGCNTPSWYLSALMFFYAAFPIIIHLALRYTRQFYAVFAALVAGYVLFLTFGVDRLSGDMPLWATRIFPLTRLLDFTLGIVLWQFYVYIRKSSGAARLLDCSVPVKTVVELAIVGLYVVAAIVASDLNLVWKSQVVWWVPTLACILIFSLLDKRGGLLTRLLDSRWAVVLGNASFAFYLLHSATLNALGRVLHFLNLSLETWPRLCVSLVLAIVVSLLVTRFFDKPVSRYLDRHFLRPSSAK